MTARDLTLHIAVNLGRIARWAAEGKAGRMERFWQETEQYLRKLERTPSGPRFQKTLEMFRQQFETLKNETNRDIAWAERVLTWASILTHRARLA